MTEFLQSIQNNKIPRILFFLLVILLPTQFGKHFWPPFSFLNGLRVDYLSPTLFVTDIIVVLFCIFTIKKIRISSLFLLFLLVVSFGIFFSKQPFSGWYELIKFLEYFFLWNSLIDFFKREKDIFSTLSIPISIAVLFESVLSFGQFFFQRSLGGIFYFFGERTFSASTPGIANASINGQLIMRPYGTLPHPNVLGAFLLIGLIILVQQIFVEKVLLKKIIFLLTSFIATLALFITLSRVAILLWIILGLYLLICNLPFKKNLRFFSAILFVVIFIGAIFLSLSHAFARFETFSFFDESVTQRIFLLNSAFSIFRNSPLFGVGFANFLINLSQVSFNSSAVYLLQPVHNVFLLLLTELGLLGFFFVIFFFLKIIIHLKKVFSINKKNIATIFMLLFTWFILGLFDHYFITLQQGQLLTTLVFALSWSFSKKSSTI